MAETSGEVTLNELPLDGLSEERYGPVGTYNVLDDYDWTLAPQTARQNVPKMFLTEYEFNSNALLANLKYWTNSIVERGVDPYKGLYRAEPTGNEYIFPWFESYNHNITQNWEDFKGLESTGLGEKIIKGFQVLTNSPGAAINTPKVWKGAARATVPYNITLFNTTGERSYTSLSKNRLLINRLIASTLHDQKNSVLATPPALFVLDIPGVRYSPACVLSNINVENIGTFVKDMNGKLVPEAFKISFQINELISESRQIFDGATGGSKVTAIVEEDVVEETVADLQGLQNN